MRASVTNDTTTRVIALEVSGVADIDVTRSYHRKPRILRPQRVLIQVVDGEVAQLKVSGGIILKSGKPSTQVSDETIWYPDQDRYRNDRVSSAPLWVRTLWNQAPAGVVSWDQPELPDLPA